MQKGKVFDRKLECNDLDLSNVVSPFLQYLL